MSKLAWLNLLDSAIVTSPLSIARTYTTKTCATCITFWLEARSDWPQGSSKHQLILEQSHYSLSFLPPTHYPQNRKNSSWRLSAPKDSFLSTGLGSLTRMLTLYSSGGIGGWEGCGEQKVWQYLLMVFSHEKWPQNISRWDEKNVEWEKFSWRRGCIGCYPDSRFMLVGAGRPNTSAKNSSEERHARLNMLSMPQMKLLVGNSSVTMVERTFYCYHRHRVRQILNGISPMFSLQYSDHLLSYLRHVYI